MEMEDIHRTKKQSKAPQDDAPESAASAGGRGIAGVESWGELIEINK